METYELKGDVLHIVSPEKAVNYKWEDNFDKLPHSLQIMSIDDFKNLPDTIKNSCFGGRNINEDAVLILEPYSRQYIPATSAEQIFYDSKFNALSHIASLLGASKISMKIESFQENKRELNLNGDISYKAVEMSASMQKEAVGRYKSMYEKTREYSSPGISSEGYKSALEYCINTRLIYDNNIKALIEQRNPNHPNPMKREIYHIELSKELNESLDAAFHLNVLKGVFTLNASVQESVSSCKRLIIETVIEF